MNEISIGNFVTQPQGFKAFIPDTFPPKNDIPLTKQITVKHTEAIRLLGKLDGITHLLPDRDCFLTMFILKDATSLLFVS